MIYPSRVCSEEKRKAQRPLANLIKIKTVNLSPRAKPKQVVQSSQSKKKKEITHTVRKPMI